MKRKAAAQGTEASERLPVGKQEDVEFSTELADAADLEAQERADLADARQERE